MTALARTGSGILDHEGFQLAVDASFVPLRIDADSPFRGSLTQAGSGGVLFTVVEATRHSVERTPEHIRRSPEPYLKLSLQVEGSGLLVQDGREVLLQPGDLAIYDTSRPYTLAFDRDVRCLVVMFPASMSEIPAADLAQLTATPLSRAGGLGSVVSPFLSSIAADLGRLDLGVGSRLAHSSVHLVDTMMLREIEELGGSATPRDRRFAEVTAYIEEHLGEADLSPASIAGAHFISLRSLHALFQAHGESVSAWIRHRRLTRCHEELADPAHAAESVARISARWGFPDAAHFSRAFRRAFDVAPSALR